MIAESEQDIATNHALYTDEKIETEGPNEDLVQFEEDKEDINEIGKADRHMGDGLEPQEGKIGEKDPDDLDAAIIAQAI